VSDELSDIQEREREALCGSRLAVIHVVDALRRYRAAVKAALAQRYSDGFIDGAHSSKLEEACRLAEFVGGEEPE
jgi:hypothetical protein